MQPSAIGLRGIVPGSLELLSPAHLACQRDFYWALGWRGSGADAMLGPGEPSGRQLQQPNGKGSVAPPWIGGASRSEQPVTLARTSRVEISGRASRSVGLSVCRLVESSQRPFATETSGIVDDDTVL